MILMNCLHILQGLSTMDVINFSRKLLIIVLYVLNEFFIILSAFVFIFSSFYFYFYVFNLTQFADFVSIF